MSFRTRLRKARRMATRNADTRKTRASRLVRGELQPTGGTSNGKKTTVKKKPAAAKQGRHVSKKKTVRKKAVAKKKTVRRAKR